MILKLYCFIRIYPRRFLEGIVQHHNFVVLFYELLLLFSFSPYFSVSLIFAIFIRAFFIQFENLCFYMICLYCTLHYINYVSHLVFP